MFGFNTDTLFGFALSAHIDLPSSSITQVYIDKALINPLLTSSPAPTSRRLLKEISHWDINQLKKHVFFFESEKWADID